MAPKCKWCGTEYIELKKCDCCHPLYNVTKGDYRKLLLTVARLTAENQRLKEKIAILEEAREQ